MSSTATSPRLSVAELTRRGVAAMRARGDKTLPPGPKRASVRQTLDWIRRPIELLRDSRERYGATFTLHFLNTDPLVMFSEPDAVKDIFTGPPDKLYAGEANLILEPILGSQSVLLLDGPRHLRQRRLLLPPFHGQRMRSYGEIIRRATERSIADWPRRRVFAVHERTQEITLEVILRAVFGVTDDHELEGLGAALTDLLESLANPFLLLPIFRVDLGPLSPGARLEQQLDDVDRRLYARIAQRRAEGDSGASDILGMLVSARDEAGEPMSDEELRDELMTLLVAGHETTATSLAWALHRLIEAPDALARLEQEVDDAFGDGEIDPDRVRELPFLDAVIKESMRLNPVIPIVGRRLQTPMRIGGVDLPAGVIAAPNIYLTHHNPDVWPDPDRFDPARMLDRKPSPYELFPFGGGVRRCVGMAFAHYEMQVVLATIVQRLRVERAPGYRLRLVRRSITFTPSEGLPIRVRDRRT